MKNDSKAILDDILARWHSYCRGFNPNPAWSAEPMFQDAASRGGWDSADDRSEERRVGKECA